LIDLTISEAKFTSYGMIVWSSLAEYDVLNAHHKKKEPRLMERMGSPPKAGCEVVKIEMLTL